MWRQTVARGTPSVVDDHSIAQADDTFRVQGDFVFVGDDHDGAALHVQLVEDGSTSAVDVESSAPVGSSARIIAGLVTMARAMATRCC